MFSDLQRSHCFCKGRGIDYFLISDIGCLMDAERVHYKKLYPALKKHYCVCTRSHPEGYYISSGLNVDEVIALLYGTLWYKHINIVRFMFVITVATLLIILVLLGIAGIVDLSAIWQKILQIKPVRFMLKFI